MKNNFFILGAFLCTALFVTSCTDDNKDDDENEGKASIIVGINMATAGRIWDISFLYRIMRPERCLSQMRLKPKLLLI